MNEEKLAEWVKVLKEVEDFCNNREDTDDRGSCDECPFDLGTSYGRDCALEDVPYMWSVERVKGEKMNENTITREELEEQLNKERVRNQVLVATIYNMLSNDMYYDVMEQANAEIKKILDEQKQLEQEKIAKCLKHLQLVQDECRRYDECCNCPFKLTSVGGCSLQGNVRGWDIPSIERIKND